MGVPHTRVPQVPQGTRALGAPHTPISRGVGQWGTTKTLRTDLRRERSHLVTKRNAHRRTQPRGPKRMNFEQNPPTETIAAYRTATALLVAVVSGDPGAEVLVDQTIRGGDDAVAGVLGALCGIVTRLAPGLASPDGLALLRAETARLATLEADAEAAAFEAAILKAQAATEARLATGAGS